MAAASGKSGLNLGESLRGLIPRVLEPRVGQLRRDLRSVLDGLRGERAPAWLARDGSRYTEGEAQDKASVGRLSPGGEAQDKASVGRLSPGGEAQDQARASGISSGLVTRELEVAARTRETADAITLTLRDPTGAALPPIRPGQFFTLLVELPGGSLRRAYSVSSDCHTREQFDITIKRIADGRASNYLHERATAGMRLRVLGPSGEFGRAPARKLVMIAGGSGITPMMAMLRTWLPTEPDREIALIYANRSSSDVIFAEPLAALEAEHRGRFFVHSVLEQPPPQWSGAVGRCDKSTLARMLDALPLASDPDVEFLLCGPAPMMAGARELLRERDVPSRRVHSESFVAPNLRPDVRLRSESVTIRMQGRETGLVVAPGQTLLEAGLAAGLAMPYSCAMGGCGACKVALEGGTVVMREPNCLGEHEREAGLVLACVANPTSPCCVRVPEPR